MSVRSLEVGNQGSAPYPYWDGVPLKYEGTGIESALVLRSHLSIWLISRPVIDFFEIRQKMFSHPNCVYLLITFVFEDEIFKIRPYIPCPKMIVFLSIVNSRSEACLTVLHTAG